MSLAGHSKTNRFGSFIRNYLGESVSLPNYTVTKNMVAENMKHTILIWYLIIVQAVAGKMCPLLLNQLSEQILLCSTDVGSIVQSNENADILVA